MDCPKRNIAAMKRTFLVSLVLVVLYAGLGLGAEAPESNGTTSAGNATATSPAATTHAPVTTQMPTSSPTTASPPPDVYAVRYLNNSFCILLQANISVTVNYTRNNKSTTATVYVPPPPQTHVSGDCNSSLQFINISFFDSWDLVLYFVSNDIKYHLYKMELFWNLQTANITGAPNVTGVAENDKLNFETSKDGYICLAKKTLYSNSSVEDSVTGVYTEKLKFEAFQSKTDTKFSSNYSRCSEDNISNLVPIIVGACLGGLILIVLIAYLIGRRRSRRGYESV